MYFIGFNKINIFLIKKFKFRLSEPIIMEEL